MTFVVRKDGVVKTKLVDRLRLGVAVSAANTITYIIRSLKLGAASVLPGEIASRIQPNILSLLSRQVKYGVIIIAGTNGKTTTSRLLRKMLENQGWRVVHNEAGANLENGLATALIERTNLFGKLKADYAILEVDENVVPKVLPKIQPKFILCLNLFRDQLDRYGEVDTISHRWSKAIAPLPPDTVVIANADDPTLSHLGQHLSQKVLFFGLSEPQYYLDEIPHAVDSIYCPSCGESLNYQGVYLSHLGDFDCPNCGFKKSQVNIDSSKWPQILIGLYNKYNTLAATLLAQQIGITESVILETIKNFQAAFGRAEELEISGKKVRILLAKNPVGMNETIRTVNEIKKAGGAATTLMILNDRIPDGTDVSWIWDVDTEKLVASGGNIVVSGDRVYDMALRIKYSQANGNNGCKLIVKEDLSEAIATALEHTPVGETLHILPTYSAMLEVRGLLTGKQIL
ncbi:UDP-N-acetylmuramyl peptide synthase [[Phormidium ambiguum] IAM M-71]|uniref:Lipid II isoglutaminyl synthase (glutamine-hydrolyzing) subunit MurT n=1 Tax=[Phormidium ambiguum] IAM M-71 TaxID=454136 RepID=A0A1U7IAM1_9CYAN|nr:Mur ligase family protein [Phormidium ambiguum]OKH33563.1 UDP-N-acetylmuramyl peptide synthase [Phormidium ambiguum IAM M-71]